MLRTKHDTQAIADAVRKELQRVAADPEAADATGISIDIIRTDDSEYKCRISLGEDTDRTVWLNEGGENRERVARILIRDETEIAEIVDVFVSEGWIEDDR